MILLQKRVSIRKRVVRAAADPFFMRCRDIGTLAVYSFRHKQSLESPDVITLILRRNHTIQMIIKKRDKKISSHHSHYLLARKQSYFAPQGLQAILMKYSRSARQGLKVPTTDAKAVPRNDLDGFVNCSSTVLLINIRIPLVFRRRRIKILTIPRQPMRL